MDNPYILLLRKKSLNILCIVGCQSVFGRLDKTKRLLFWHIEVTNWASYWPLIVCDSTAAASRIALTSKIMFNADVLPLTAWHNVFPPVQLFTHTHKHAYTTVCWLFQQINYWLYAPNFIRLPLDFIQVAATECFVLRDREKNVWWTVPNQ